MRQHYESERKKLKEQEQANYRQHWDDVNRRADILEGQK